MNYYIGIDGGGTKTKVRVMDENFQNIDSLKGGASNIASLGKDKVKNNIEIILNELLGKNNLCVESCIGLCIGSAGVDREEEKLEMGSIFTELGFKKVKVVNDTQIILSSETRGKDGMVVISGTGSIVYGLSNGVEKRAGGWGYLLGDEGSGFWIGHEAIKAVLNSNDKVISETTLTNRILNKLEINYPSDLIGRFYSKADITKLEIASLAKLVDEEANNGDSISKDILYRGANELARRVKPIYDQLYNKSDNVDIVLNGSVINNSDIFKNEFINAVNGYGENFTFKPISKDASYGACYLNKRGE